MPAKLGVQILGDSVGLTAALGESVAATNRWATETEAATVRVQESFRGVSTAALELQVAQDKLAISTVRYGQGSTGAAAATLAYRRQVEGLSAAHTAAARSIGRGLTTYVTAPTALLGYEAVKAGISFQTEMLRIQTQAGASAQEVKDLNSQVLAMAGTVGVGPSQLAQGLFHLESLGLRGAQAMEALKVASIAAGASGANLEDVTTALGGAVVTGINGVQNYSQAMGGLIAIAGEGNMRMEDLTAALGTGVLPAAKNAGVSLREVGAALAVLTDRGMSAENAGTRLRMTFALMQHPSAAAQKALKDLGIGSGEMAQMLAQPDGLLHVLQLLHDRMAAVGQIRGSRDVLGAFGGGRSGAGILTLIQSLDSAVSSYQGKLVGYDEGVKKAAANMAAYQQSNAFKIHQATASLESDMVKLGGAITPVLLGVGKSIEALAAGFSLLPKASKEAIGIIVGVLAVGGPLILAIIGVQKAIRTIGTAFDLLPAEAAPGIAATGAEIEAGIGGAVTTAEAEVTALRLSLLSLGGLALAPIVIPIAYEVVKKLFSGNSTQIAAGLAKSYDSNIKTGYTTNTDEITSALGLANREFGRNNPLSDALHALLTKASKEIAATGRADITKADIAAITAAYQSLPSTTVDTSVSANPGSGQHRKAPVAATPTSVSTGSVKPSTAVVAAYHPSRAAELNLALAKNPTDRAAIEAKLAYDREAAAFAEKRIAEGRGNKALVQSLQAVYADETSLEDQLKSMSAKAKSAQQKRLKLEEAFNLPLNLQLEEAKARASGKQPLISDALEDEKRWVLAKIHAGKLTVQAEIAAYNELTNLNSQLATQTSTLTGTFRYASLASLTKGITDRNVRLAVEARIAQAQAHSGRLPTGEAATYITVNGGVHAHGVQDVQGLVDVISEHGSRGTATRRGHNAGRYLGRH